MLTGRHVLVYSNQQKFESRIPGIICRDYQEAPTTCDVAGFFPKTSAMAHSTCLERVIFVKTADEARDAFNRGARWVCAEYDLKNPQPLCEAVQEEAPAPTKPQPRRAVVNV